MGTTGATAMAEEVAVNNIKMEQALVWHLQCNHYPPVPVSMVAPCIRAIEKANRGEWNAQVRMPKGITYRGKSLAPVSTVIEQHHLESFLDCDEEDW